MYLLKSIDKARGGIKHANEIASGPSNQRKSAAELPHPLPSSGLFHEAIQLYVRLRGVHDSGRRSVMKDGKPRSLHD